MLAADAVHLFPHLDEARIFPTTYNLGEVLEGYETLKRLRRHAITSCRATIRGDEDLSGGVGSLERARCPPRRRPKV